MKHVKSLMSNCTDEKNQDTCHRRVLVWSRLSSDHLWNYTRLKNERRAPRIGTHFVYVTMRFYSALDGITPPKAGEK